jgi:hypothetical protein
MAKKDASGLIYVEFTTNHFTDFALGEGTCSLVINNNEQSTTNIEVKLQTNCDIKPDVMRFSNSSLTIDTAKWVPFQEGYPWKLE